MSAPIFLETIIGDRILLYILQNDVFCESHIKVQKFRDYTILAKFFLAY